MKLLWKNDTIQLYVNVARSKFAHHLAGEAARYNSKLFFITPRPCADSGFSQMAWLGFFFLLYDIGKR